MTNAKYLGVSQDSPTTRLIKDGMEKYAKEKDYTEFSIVSVSEDVNRILVVFDHLFLPLVLKNLSVYEDIFDVEEGSLPEPIRLAVLSGNVWHEHARDCIDVAWSVSYYSAGVNKVIAVYSSKPKSTFLIPFNNIVGAGDDSNIVIVAPISSRSVIDLFIDVHKFEKSVDVYDFRTDGDLRSALSKFGKAKNFTAYNEALIKAVKAQMLHRKDSQEEIINMLILPIYKGYLADIVGDHSVHLLATPEDYDHILMGSLPKSFKYITYANVLSLTVELIV